MNEKNFEYLKDQLKYSGFGDSLNDILKEKINQQSKEFQLFLKQEFGPEQAVATLHFRQSDQSDMYFFNKYDLRLKNDQIDDVVKQTFYMGKDNNITLKEGFNLLNGRAVNKDLHTKEGLGYNAWIQLNFKETEASGNYVMQKFHQNYGFDLDKALSKLPIKELGNEQDKQRLMDSLKKGNRQTVTISKDGLDQKIFIEANPKFKTVTVYDENMQRVQSNNQKEKKSTEQSAKQETPKIKSGPSDDGDAPAQAAPKKTKKKKQSIS